MIESQPCPDCGRQAVVVGAIPDTNLFAGRTLEEPLPGGLLWRCKGCSLGFRHPRLPKQQLDALYAKGNEWNWNAPSTSRRDWKIVRDWTKSLLLPGRKVLDVGCFDGGFLAPLIGHYDCNGIEIHAAASERASQKGVRIVGADFSEVTGQYDLITAFDVIEHMQSPVAFINQCVSALQPGGLLLLSTGNLDSPTFRLLGSRYWYCTVAEHISFISPTWFSKSTACDGFRVVREARFAHQKSTITLRLRQATINLLYRFVPAGFRFMRKIGFGGVKANSHLQLADHPPNWGTARDHFMVLLQKT